MGCCRTALLAAVLVACAGPGSATPDRRRVVSLHQVTTEIVVAVGAAGELAGVMEPLFPDPELERALAGVPRVAGLESILAVEPDLVLGLGVVAEQSPDLVRALRARGVEVFLADPATVEEVADLVSEIGDELGASATAGEVARVFRARVGRVSAPGAPVRVFVYDCCDPPFTAGRNTVLTDLLDRAGGSNVFADQLMDWDKVSWEAVVDRAPQLVVVHEYHWDGQGSTQDKRALLRQIPGLEQVPTLTLSLRDTLGGLNSPGAFDSLRATIGGMTSP